MRYIFIFSILFSLFSCSTPEKPKDDFEHDTYIQTFGERKTVPLGNSGFTIDLPTTHYIQEIKGNGFVEFHIRSTDTTINKGEGIVRFNLLADEKDASMVKDTNIAFQKYDSLNPYPNGPQIYKWTQNEANQVEQFNLSQTMNSIHR